MLSHRSCSSRDFRVKVRGQPSRSTSSSLDGISQTWCKKVRLLITASCLSGARLKPRAGCDRRSAVIHASLIKLATSIPESRLHLHLPLTRPPFTPSDLAASGDSEGGAPLPRAPPNRPAQSRGAVHSCRRAVSQSPGQTPVTVSVGFTAKQRKKKRSAFSIFLFASFIAPGEHKGKRGLISIYLSLTSVSRGDVQLNGWWVNHSPQ